MFNKVLLISFSLILVSCIKVKNECFKTRAAFDIGSGTTKVKVAKVDNCTKRIVEFLYSEEIPIAFKEDLQSKTSGIENMFSDNIQNVGYLEIKKIYERVRKFNPDEIIGVGTSAFRSADNAPNFFSKIKSEIGFDVLIIDQSKEAEIGFYSAALMTDQNPDDIVVWDIGGGSMQMIAKDGEKFESFLGQMGALVFKNEIIAKIKKKNPKVVTSPNPLGDKDFLRGVDMAKNDATSNVSEKFRELLKTKKNVYGIGGVHVFSVYGQVGENKGYYTLDKIEAVQSTRSNLNDAQIGGKYAETEVTNLALVLGYMKALKLEKVNILKVNLSEGILVYPEIVAR